MKKTDSFGCAAVCENRRRGCRYLRAAAFVATAVFGIFSVTVAFAQTPQFNIVKPSTTGVPGDEVRVMRFDPSGNLWIASREIFFQEWAVAMLSADQLGPNPLPGGGFDTGAWRVWSTVHGAPLPSQYIYDMEFSSDGTMWLASDGGLTRFRPNAPDPADRWFTYTMANAPFMMNEVLSIAIDSQDNLWVSNARQNYALSKLLKLNTVTGVWTSIDTAGQQPWVVSIGNNDHVLLSLVQVGGLMEFNGSTWSHHSTDAYQMEAMVQDAQGNIWASPGVNGDGLWKWNGSSWQNWPTIGGTITVTGIGKDRDGIVYVSTWYGGIYKMINDTPVFFADADNIPRGVIGRPNGDIWINNYGGNGTYGTVRHYNAAGQLYSKMNKWNSGLPDYFVDRISSDSAGNMWFATGEAGLSRMLGHDGAPTASTHWRNWGNHNDQAEPYPWAGNEPMYSVFEDTKGIYWMGGNGVGRWDSATGEFTNFWNWQNSNLDVAGIRTIAKRQGTIWAGSGGSGVWWLDGNNWIHVPLSTVFNYDINYVNAMTVDTENNLWVASNYGLRKFAPGDNLNFTEYYTSNSPLPSDYILDLVADPAGGIWIGTAAGGLTRFDGTNWTTYNQANTGMPGTNVSGIARRASDGLIAIANNQPSTWPYTGGVSTFDGHTWTHYTSENSPLTHWQCVSVAFDADGNLWASPMSEGVVQIMLGRPNASIAGTVTYGNAIGNPTTRPVSNVTISGAGSPNVNAITSFPGGNYTLSGFGAGSYTITPTKVGGVNSISSFDAAKIAQHVAGVSVLAGNQFTVADVSGNGTLSSFDAAELARYVVAMPGSGSTGNWIFSPANRAYAAVTASISGEDYSALLMGDVSGNWTDTGAKAMRENRKHSPQTGDNGIGVELPTAITPSGKDVIIPVKVNGIAAKDVISYEFTLRYDASVMQPSSRVVDLKGTVSRGFAFAANATQPGVLRVVVYGAMPITDDGVLLNLKFTTVGRAGVVSPLTFEQIMFNEGEASVNAGDGKVQIF
jgi:ligand-binding sensor domain-containing protein